LATPRFLSASNPEAKSGNDAGEEGPSKQPDETLTALKAKLDLTIDAMHRSGNMMALALACDGAVLTHQRFAGRDGTPRSQLSGSDGKSANGNSAASP
jgi:hypothetical protein